MNLKKSCFYHFFCIGQKKICPTHRWTEYFSQQEELFKLYTVALSLNLTYRIVEISLYILAQLCI